MGDHARVFELWRGIGGYEKEQNWFTHYEVM